jgi:Malectin domain
MDLYLILAPVLLIPMVLLLRFIGCGPNGCGGPPFTSGGTSDEEVIVMRINCGGPAVAPDASKGETVGWDADSATAGTAGSGELGRPKVTDDNRALAGEVYETWRIGPSEPEVLAYVFTLDEGDYKVTLKFARLDSNVNIGGKFLVQFKDDPPIEIDAADSIHPLARKFDHEQEVHVDASGQLTINFQVYQLAGGGTLPFINAIEVKE